MSELDYLLVVLTHGTHGRADTFEQTLGSFLDRVSPPPAKLYVHQDGEGSAHYGPGFPTPLAFTNSVPPVGFCGAVRKAWTYAAEQAHPFVFWLEHDFLFLDDVDLRPLAAVLDAEPQLAQMGLMREPVNEREAAAGGLYSLNRDRYWPRDGWLLSRTNFSTTCSLMRRDFMARHPWPDYPSECEGRFSIDLLEAGYSFAVWGDGTPQLRHTGVRTGFGY